MYPRLTLLASPLLLGACSLFGGGGDDVDSTDLSQAYEEVAVRVDEIAAEEKANPTGDRSPALENLSASLRQRSSGVTGEAIGEKIEAVGGAASKIPWGPAGVVGGILALVGYFWKSRAKKKANTSLIQGGAK